MAYESVLTVNLIGVVQVTRCYDCALMVTFLSLTAFLPLGAGSAPRAQPPRLHSEISAIPLQGLAETSSALVWTGATMHSCYLCPQHLPSSICATSCAPARQGQLKIASQQPSCVASNDVFPHLQGSLTCKADQGHADVLSNLLRDVTLDCVKSCCAMLWHTGPTIMCHILSCCPVLSSAMLFGAMPCSALLC